MLNLDFSDQMALCILDTFFQLIYQCNIYKNVCDRQDNVYGLVIFVQNDQKYGWEQIWQLITIKKFYNK